MSTAPDPHEVAAAIAKAVEPFRAQLESVMLHGSLVRGDFWPGQSDIDVMIIGRPGAAPDPVANVLKALPIYGPIFEPHPCLVEQVAEQLASPFEKRTWTQFTINGFDLKQSHLLVLGTDFLASASVPLGEQLRGLARARVRGLLDYECVRYPEETWKWGADAVKAAQLYFTLRRGGTPTRHKREAIANFWSHVPSFGKQEFARVIWANYEAGLRPNDAGYRTDCLAFIADLWTVVEAHP